MVMCADERNIGMMAKKWKVARAYLNRIPARPPMAVFFLYHTVEKGISPWTYGHRYITQVEQFKKQLAYINKHFDIVSTKLLISKLEQEDLKKNTAAIHFDDGFTSYASTALPFLLEYKMPSMIFPIISTLSGGIPVRNKIAFCLNSGWRELLLEALCPFFAFKNNQEMISSMDNFKFLAWIKNNLTGEMEEKIDEVFTGCRRRNNQSSPFMDEQTLREIIAHPHVEIGSHTINHPILSDLPIEKQKAEITEGHKGIERLTGERVRYFAYPHGGPSHFNEATKQIVRGLNLVAFSAHGGINKNYDAANVKRITLTSHTPFDIKKEIFRAI